MVNNGSIPTTLLMSVGDWVPLIAQQFLTITSNCTSGIVLQAGASQTITINVNQYVTGVNNFTNTIYVIATQLRRSFFLFFFSLFFSAFNLLYSGRYFQTCIKDVESIQLAPWFKEESVVSRHQLFGLTLDYNTDIENANFAKLTRVLVVGYLYMVKMLMWY